MHSATIDFLKELSVEEAEIGIVLGSGLGDIVDEMREAIHIDYNDIPNFPVSTVEGHTGRLVYGLLGDKKVLALQGRFHYYEGYDMQTVTLPIRLFKELGVKHMIVTNAAGGVNESFKPGDLMVITDHINLTGENPLIGENYDEHGPRFLDMSEPYSKRTSAILKEIARDMDIDLKEGVYTWMTGPSYETPAEIRAIRTLGGDAVGMSTVPEVIVARHTGMEVTGISCITNYAAGMQDALNHEEVVQTSARVRPIFVNLLTELIKRA